jgi:NADPH:quinone reductase-like Zn-dependent oxidoreductase
MKAVIIRSYGGPEVLELADVPPPSPGPGQLRIRTTAAAVNPVDLATRAGALTQAGILRPLPVTGIGWDVAGTVDALGDGVTGFAVGDPAVGLCDLPGRALKAQAEYVVLDATAVGTVPPGTDLIGAATLPLNGLTAAQALDLLSPAAQTVLVTGAAGAVGGYAVELAARDGRHVVATAAAGDEELVRSLGAKDFVPRGADLPTAVRALLPGGADAAVDAAHLGLPALDAVRGGGEFVAVLGGAPLPLRGIRVRNVWIHADGPRLTRLAAMNLRYRIAGVLPLSEVAEAHQRLAAGPVRGRLVLTP